MDLTQKFKDVASGTAVRIESFDVDKRYPVLRYNETWKDNLTHYQRRRLYCGKNVLAKTIWRHFLVH